MPPSRPSWPQCLWLVRRDRGQVVEVEALLEVWVRRVANRGEVADEHRLRTGLDGAPVHVAEGKSVS